MSIADDVIVALIPSYGSGHVHSTLCYCGFIYNCPPANVLCERARMLAQMWPSISATVTELRMLGKDQNEPAAMIDGTELYAVHDFVDEFAYSNWGYLPHIAQQKQGDLPHVGAAVVFDRIAVWYGTQRWAWRFGSASPCAT